MKEPLRMRTDGSTGGPDRGHAPDEDQERERRLELLIRRLPPRLRTTTHRLRRPDMRWVRIPAGLFLVAGGLVSILPVFGLWMLPLGLVLLAEDMAPLRRATGRVLAWIEHRPPHWMGLAQAHPSLTAERERGARESDIGRGDQREF
jgi:hypothetical protein